VARCENHARQLEGYPERKRHDPGDGGGRCADGDGTDWVSVYGRVATALGILPSAIDEEPAINIFKLLEYWAEEPPTHVILALRYLGQKKKPSSPEAAIDQLQGAMEFMGAPAGPVPEHIRAMADWVEANKPKSWKPKKK
jgi:hypothetical protein